MISTNKILLLKSYFRNNPLSQINYNQRRNSFYERYKHGPRKISNPEPTKEDYVKWTKEAFGRKGVEELKKQAGISYHRLVHRQFPKNHDTNKLYIFEDFDNDRFLNEWKVGCDSDSLHGFSSGELIRSKNGHALFKGLLDNRLPEDGITENSGFVALIGPGAPKEKFFQFETRWNWSPFNTFEIRFRGDGRVYYVVVNTASYRNDLQFYDNYTYPLYTRGGPYWQTMRIPFKNFVFTAKNSPQDTQTPLNPHRVKFVAINIQDKIDGPFALEIDYMGLRADTMATDEISPYENYQFAHIRYREVSVGCDPPED